MANQRRQLAQILRKQPWIMATAFRIWRLTRTKVTVGAIGVITNTKGEILLVEHVFHPKHPWGLPGGWVERNEQPAQTVEREIKEELALNVTAENILLAEFTEHGHLDIAIKCAPIETDVEIRLSAELLNYGWFTTTQLPNIRIFHRNAIQRALNKTHVNGMKL